MFSQLKKQYCKRNQLGVSFALIPRKRSFQLTSYKTTLNVNKEVKEVVAVRTDFLKPFYSHKNNKHFYNF